jgi:hypothetical protein
MLVKQRNGTGAPVVYYGDSAKYLEMNSTGAALTDSTVWNNTAPSSTTFSIGTSAAKVNDNVGTYVAYLFASLPGISKVGSYTGNGSSQTINCGFTTGARFVLVKSVNVVTNWVVLDTARGIVAGDDPMLFLNTTSQEFTNQDPVDADNTGFVVNSTGAGLNTLNEPYIYLAIA